MSKVIKQPEDFVPDTLFPERESSDPVWSDLATPYEVPSSDSGAPQESRTDSQEMPTDHSSQQEEIDTNFENDFSSPLPDPIEEPAQELPEEDPIDIEAIQEEFFNKGIQVGIERSENDYGLSVKALQSACEQLNALRETILKNSLTEMQDLVIKIAEKIIRSSVSSQKDTIVKTIEEALHIAVKSDAFTIRINPEDYFFVQEKSQDFIQSVSGLENIIFKQDPKVDQGGCLLESDNCIVDATIVGQLDLIGQKLKK